MWKLFPDKPHHASRITRPIQMNTLSAESEAAYVLPDIIPIKSQATPPVIVHIQNAPDDDTDTPPPIVRLGNTPEGDQDTAVMTDSLPVVQDTNLTPSASTDADNTGGISENIIIIEGLRKEIWNTRLQMDNLQKDYAEVISSRDEAAETIRRLNKNMAAVIEKGEQDAKSAHIQYIKMQSKLDTLEKMWKDILEKQSFTLSSLETVVRSLQPFIQQLDTSINNYAQKLDTSITKSTQTLTNLLTALQYPAPPPPAPEPPSYQAGGLQEFKKMFKEFFAAPFAFRGLMTALILILLTVWLSSVIGVLTAEINLTKNPLSLSPFHDGFGITACVSSIIIGIIVPLAAIDKSSTVPDICKMTAQVVMWCLTIVSIIWAGRLALEALLHSLRN